MPADEEIIELIAFYLFFQKEKVIENNLLNEESIFQLKKHPSFEGCENKARDYLEDFYFYGA